MSEHRRSARSRAASSPNSEPLSAERIISAAVRLADAEGIDATSMRRLGQHLGVDPMSLYHHVRDKNALLDGMAEAVVADIRPVDATGDWVVDLRATILAARTAMLAHSWSSRLIETRESPTPAALAHIDRVLGILRGGGCSVALAHHALHVLGSRVLGFSQDLFDDTPDSRPEPAIAAAQAQAWLATHPHVAELAMTAAHDGGLGGCDDDEEFAFSLDLMLEGLERRRLAAV